MYVYDEIMDQNKQEWWKMFTNESKNKDFALKLSISMKVCVLCTLYEKWKTQREIVGIETNI